MRVGRAGSARRAWFLLLALLLVTSPAAAQGNGFPRTVIDATGAAVTIPAYPQVVATAGHDPVLAQVVPGARVIDLAGRTEWAGVGLLVLSPVDLAAYPGLGQAGVPVFQTVPPRSLAEWRAALRRLGRAAGREWRAAWAILRLDVQIAAARWQAARRPAVRWLVLTPEGYTFGRDTLITDLIAAAGGINAAAEAGFADFRQIDDATIRALAPQVIALTPAWSAGQRAAFAANPAYAGVPAIEAGRVVTLPFSPTLPDDPAAALRALAAY